MRSLLIFLELDLEKGITIQSVRIRAKDAEWLSPSSKHNGDFHGNLSQMRSYRQGA